MTNAHIWEPGTAYGQGDVVEYNGHYYKIIQPHRSQGDWTPDVTPALWGRIPSDQCHNFSTSHNQPTQGQQQLGDNHSANQSWQQPGGTGAPKKDDDDSDDDDDAKEKAGQGWLTEKRKNELLIAGGILTAGAVVGGGVFAYSKHKSKKEERAKVDAWKDTTEDVWRQGAVARTEAAGRGQATGKVYWVYTEGDNIPQNAIYGGREGDGQQLYIARCFHEGGLHPGKAGRHLQGGASISWGGQEIVVAKHEILVGDETAVEWITLNGRVEKAIEKTDKTPVEGGRERDGTFLFVARAKHEGGVYPAKAHEDADYANFGWGGQELSAKEYQVLFYR